MNLLLRPARYYPPQPGPVIQYRRTPPKPVFDHMTDDDEILVVILAIDERKGQHR